MNYTERLSNVTVLGAAGKMGSGILLLTALEMADLSLKPENKGKLFVINAIDVSSEALIGLMRYIRAQTLKAAEKKTVQLRLAYADRADLIDNDEIIRQYIEDVMVVIRPSVHLETAYSSTLIFEAIKEDPELKVKILSQIDRNNPLKPWYFTNTSSIPITQLDEKAKLGGRIIGFHFYNPPAVQKLVEVIKSNQTLPEVEEFALQYAKNLRKVVVPSNDFAGFIGNGHFMRDALHGIAEAKKLAKEVSLAEAIYMINRVSQEYLVRPMGIFQLIDYVGIDVCQYIMSVMNPYQPNEDLHSDLLDRMIALGVKGGQHSDGSQKDGFLKYDKGRVVGVYNPDSKAYVMIADFQPACDTRLGAQPASMKPWKSVVGAPLKENLLQTIFNEMKTMDNLGAELARKYAKRSKEIGLKLVADKVAFNDNDVNTVLLTGFYHAYGPINNYLD
ncbi:MAG: 3-hydroxyacyl-CoA dehydrogenase family protein [Bacteroidetes bacterium]|nr:MAG: 3-hydroxyacyl-CoA dehydrogenase family protein [Bacteroidota bacterium]